MSISGVSYTMDETNPHSFLVGLVIILVVAFLIIKLMTRTAGDILLKLQKKGKDGSGNGESL